MDHFAAQCEEWVKVFQPDAILGYSFGAAVATHWKTSFGLSTPVKIILVSPALERAYAKSPPHWTTRLKKYLPQQFTDILRSAYLRFIVKNPFYAEGTPFLRKTYLEIVGIHCGQKLSLLPPEDYIAIFGAEDDITPPQNLLAALKDIPVAPSRILTISGGGHDITNTHTDELVGKIKDFLFTPTTEPVLPPAAIPVAQPHPVDLADSRIS